MTDQENKEVDEGQKNQKSQGQVKIQKIIDSPSLNYECTPLPRLGNIQIFQFIVKIMRIMLCRIQLYKL